MNTKEAIELIDTLIVISDKIDIQKIYRIAHAFNVKASCYKSHADWREEARSLYSELIKEGEIRKKGGRYN